ncbi:MAG: hypothetical protein EA350_04810 [Gemmatimonadales bacterium]|nr:MAG: hypothetical protein EA350_04810 [Gemmatimonadales bacterium]
MAPGECRGSPRHQPAHALPEASALPGRGRAPRRGSTGGMMGDPSSFRTRTLTESDSLDFLAGRNIGRLAYLEGGLIEVRPVGYAASGDWIFGRLGPGRKTEALLRHRWVTFQVDEVRDHWNWRSVVLHGALHFLDGMGGAAAAAARERALVSLAAAIPGFGEPGDPGSFRDMIFGVEIQEISGVEGYLEGA